jgi:MoaA/NifB/PqqE/SkfB family radical SAM enzyme
MKTFPDFPLFVVSSFHSVISRNRTTNCTWELTYRCNAKCGFCSYWKKPTDPNEELRLSEVKKGLDAIYRYGCRLVNFSGGEPTLRDDLEDILSHAAKKRIWTSLVTNGSRLDRKRIRELKTAGLDNLFISLDFIEREAHDSQRKMKGLFDQAIRGLECLGTDFIGGHHTAGIMCVVSDVNLDSARKLAELAKKNRVFITFQLYHSQKSENDAFRIKDIQKVSSTLLRLKMENWNVLSSKSYISGMKNFQGNPNPCSAGRKYFSIDPLGFLHPCVDLPKVGHILRDPVSVIRSERALSSVKQCKGCWYCFRGEADHALSIRGSFEKIEQFGRIIVENR